MVKTGLIMVVFQGKQNHTVSYLVGRVALIQAQRIFLPALS